MINRLPLIALLVCTQLLLAQDQPPPCCFDATCIYCVDIQNCDNGPFGPADFAAVGGEGNCGVDHPTTLCSSWMENNTLGLTECISPCGDPIACNFDPVYGPDAPDYAQNCTYGCGCADSLACNYDPYASVESDSCLYPDSGLDCAGLCLVDNDGDGVCDGDEILGCTDELACNFDSAATDDDGLCQFSSDDMAFTGNCGLDHEDTILVCSLMDYNGLMPTCWPSLTGTFADSSVTISQNDGPCTTSVPEPYEDGEFCSGLDPHIMAIYYFLGDETFFLSNSADGNFTYILGDTLIWTSTIAIDASISNGFNVEIVYGPAMSWIEWQSQPFPTGYKRDCGQLIDDHENWDYRIIVQGVMTGFGQFEGVEYQINHSPSNLYYAHQFGYAANNANNNYGGSGPLILSNETEWYSVDWKVDIACQSTKLLNFAASDDCQNQVSHQITVLEAGPTDGPTLPVITSDAHDLEVSSDGLGNTAELEAWLANNGGAEASSYCGALTWSNDFTDVIETCGNTGYTTVTFTATDEAGNSVSTQATFATTDDFAPVITAPPSITYSCDEVVLESLLWGPQGYSSYYSAADLSEVTTTIEDTFLSNEPCSGVIERVYIATDACDNITQFTQIITLTDDEAPTASIQCPSDIELGLDPECSANTTVGNLGMAAAFVVDNCDPNATVNITWEDGATTELCGGSYEFTRTFSAYAVDDCDNTSIATCTQTIVVVDVTPPSLTTASLDDVSVELNEFCDYDTSVDGLGTVDFAADDDCSDVTIEVTYEDGPVLWTGTGGDILVEGTYFFERVFTVIATDDCGNSTWDTQSQIVQAFDVTAPTFDGSILEFFISCENANSLASCVEYDDESLYGIQVQDNCDSEVNVTILSSTLITGGAEFNIFRIYEATDDNGNTSTFEQIIYVNSPIECSDPAACNYEVGSEGSADCDYSCYGCTDPFACNYSSQATTPDFSCEYNSCAGCTDPGACNFDAGATINNGDCFYYGPILDCDGQCINDTDGDGVCDENEILGCQDPEACNYESLATDPDECTYPASAYTLCDGTCINDTDGDEVCDEEEVVGCQDPLACDFDVLATDSVACTYPAEAYLDCQGECLNDADGDGICDELEIPGCPDPSACNFESEATDDDGSCVPSGCMDPDACNYLAAAGCDDGNCEYSCCPGPGCCLDGTVWDNDSQGCIVANPTDVDLDGCTGVGDVLEVLANFGQCFNVDGPCFPLENISHFGVDYELIEAGGECWFKSGLNATVYREGTPILNLTSDGDWTSTSDGAYCYYNNAPSSSSALYNFYAIMHPEGVCPSGFHVPQKEEWDALIADVNGSFSSLSELGFAFANGTRVASSGDFVYLSDNAHARAWSSSVDSTQSPSPQNGQYVWHMYGDFSPELLFMSTNFNNAGMRIHCVKD